ncbi:MAG: hypothetical protein BJ554DRAFT_902 [Olpidium bornovanus]|uniref:Uncharacterized protein n=1 Tax=Olpidium bornovanus TaxID=278681 RepID=A0A8H8A1C8_9FUNG|nr:MAG: hypothetical protein BJ554DRAFT_902 [Olpidium bornovanus]
MVSAEDGAFPFPQRVICCFSCSLTRGENRFCSPSPPVHSSDRQGLQANDRADGEDEHEKRTAPPPLPAAPASSYVFSRPRGRDLFAEPLPFSFSLSAAARSTRFPGLVTSPPAFVCRAAERNSTTATFLHSSASSTGGSSRTRVT